MMLAGVLWMSEEDDGTDAGDIEHAKAKNSGTTVSGCDTTS